MTEELRKRLQDAAIKRVNSNKMLSHEEGTGALLGFMWGAEYGFKEAIARAGMWIFGYIRSNSNDLSAYDAERDFEKYMNELWEDIK